MISQRLVYVVSAVSAVLLVVMVGAEALGVPVSVILSSLLEFTLRTLAAGLLAAVTYGSLSLKVRWRNERIQKANIRNGVLQMCKSYPCRCGHGHPHKPCSCGCPQHSS